MKIEIFGLPGVGKTHIINLLLNKHPNILKYLSKYSQHSWLEILRDFPYYFKHPFLITSCNFEKNRNAILLRFKRIARRKKFIIKQDNCVLNDSGTIQPLIEAYILSVNLHLKIDWIELFNEQIMDHCYFLINDSIDNIVLRESNRSSRTFSLNQNELTLKYNECQNLINLIKKNMFLYEFSLCDYDHAEVLIDDIYKKMMEVLNYD